MTTNSIGAEVVKWIRKNVALQAEFDIRHVREQLRHLDCTPQTISRHVSELADVGMLERSSGNGKYRRVSP